MADYQLTPDGRLDLRQGTEYARIQLVPEGNRKHFRIGRIAGANRKLRMKVRYFGRLINAHLARCNKYVDPRTIVPIPSNLFGGAKIDEHYCPQCVGSARKHLRGGAVLHRVKESPVHLRRSGTKRPVAVCGSRVRNETMASTIDEALASEKRLCFRCREAVLAHLTAPSGTGAWCERSPKQVRHLVREPTDLVRMCPDCLRLWAEAARRQSAQG